jgi:hypothetical protein
MTPTGRRRHRRGAPSLLPVALVLPVLLFARDAPARGLAQPREGIDTPMTAASRDVRSASWAGALAPIAVTSLATGDSASIRLYDLDGEIDEAACMRLEHVIARDGEQHVLAPRLEQLLVKAAHHFGDAHVLVVSGWRERAGRHTSGEALDFKLRGSRRRSSPRTCAVSRAWASASTRTRAPSTSTSTSASRATTGSTGRPRVSRGRSVRCAIPGR